VEVDEFGLSAAQKRLQLKALEKFQHYFEKVQDAQNSGNAVVPVSASSRNSDLQQLKNEFRCKR
jgi:hypothetical protein